MLDINLETGEIRLYDTIGPGWADMIDDIQVTRALDAMGGRDVELRLNSPGGDVDIGNSIYNALQRYPGRVTSYVDGLAASAASFVMLAADEVIAAENAVLMIHRPWTIAMGNADDLNKTVEVLDTYERSMLSMYAAKTGQSVDNISQALADETWFTADEAIDFGLVDRVANDTEEIVDDLEIAAKCPRAAQIAARADEFRLTAKQYPKRTALRLKLAAGLI